MKHQKHLFLGLSGAVLALVGTVTATNGTSPPTDASLVWGDVDGDGLEDVLAIDAKGSVRLLMNFGGGRFEDITLASGLAELGGASCALLADLDGDERPDLFLGSSETRVWRNLGDGTFEPLASGVEHDLVDLAARAVDRDGDGRPDLQVHTEAGDLAYRNLGEGRFERVELPPVHTPAHMGWAAPEIATGAEAFDARIQPGEAENEVLSFDGDRLRARTSSGSVP